MSKFITCEESELLRPTLKPWASRTNYGRGEEGHSDPRFPDENYTEWCDDDEVVRLIDILNAKGCTHEVVERDTKEKEEEED